MARVFQQTVKIIKSFKIARHRPIVSPIPTCDFGRANEAREGLGWGNTGAQMQKTPRYSGLGVPERLAQIRQTDRAVGHLGGWGTANDQSKNRTARGVLSGTGVPNGWPNNRTLEWPRRYIPLCIRRKGPVPRYTACLSGAANHLVRSDEAAITCCAAKPVWLDPTPHIARGSNGPLSEGNFGGGGRPRGDLLEMAPLTTRRATKRCAGAEQINI